MLSDADQKTPRTRDSVFTRRFREAFTSPLKPEMHRIGTTADVETFVIDVEATNRCNARCSFCPRDKTPHQGLMTRETFEQVLFRSVEFRSVVQSMQAGLLDFSFCGLGESMLHPELPLFMQRATEEGFKPCLCSNGSLLDRDRAATLLDAGLSDIFFNVGELGEDYDSVYGLPFEQTSKNIEQFIELAAGRCDVWIVLVDQKMDPAHTAKLREFWSERGVSLFYPSPILNRAGSLEHEMLNFKDHPMDVTARQLFGKAIPGCAAPSQCLSIGYDGKFYLCNSDWGKEESAGTVFELSMLESMRIRLERARDRENTVCRRCNHDPLNQINRLLVQGAEQNLIDEGIAIMSRRQQAASGFIDSAVEFGHLVQEIEE